MMMKNMMMRKASASFVKYAKEAIKVPEKRVELVRKLELAIEEVFNLAREASPTSDKASARPDKLRYYDLMADMIRVLDGVLENVSIDQLEEKIASLEEKLVELAEDASKPASEDSAEGAQASS